MPHKPKEKKPPIRSPLGRTNPQESETDRWDDQPNLDRRRPEGAFTPGELGAPDQDPSPGQDNPQAVQGGLGPLGQDGQGNRQNDELAELEMETKDPESGRS